MIVASPTHLRPRYDVAVVGVPDERYGEELRKWIQVGASPRGVIGLDKCSRVHAWLQGRDHVIPDDVRAMVHDVLRHRIMLSYEANAGGIDSDQVIDRILELTDRKPYHVQRLCVALVNRMYEQGRRVITTADVEAVAGNESP